MTAEPTCVESEEASLEPEDRWPGQRWRVVMPPARWGEGGGWEVRSLLMDEVGSPMVTPARLTCLGFVPLSPRWNRRFVPPPPPSGLPLPPPSVGMLRLLPRLPPPHFVLVGGTFPRLFFAFLLLPLVFYHLRVLFFFLLDTFACSREMATSPLSRPAPTLVHGQADSPSRGSLWLDHVGNSVGGKASLLSSALQSLANRTKP